MKRLLCLLLSVLLVPVSCFALTPKADSVYVAATDLNDDELIELISSLQSLHASRSSNSDHSVLSPGDVLFDDGQLKITFEEFIIKYPALYLRCLYENNSDALLRIEAKHFTVNGWDAITYHGLGDDTAIITSHTKTRYNLKFPKGAGNTEIKSVDDIEYFECNFEVKGENYTKLFDFYDEPTRFNMK